MISHSLIGSGVDIRHGPQGTVSKVLQKSLMKLNDQMVEPLLFISLSTILFIEDVPIGCSIGETEKTTSRYVRAHLDGLCFSCTGREDFAICSYNNLDRMLLWRSCFVSGDVIRLLAKRLFCRAVSRMVLPAGYAS